MMEVEIREAVAADLPVLIDFQQKLAFESEGLKLEASTLEKGMKAMFQDKTRGYYSVAQVNNEIVGCFMITFEWSDWRNGWVYWLQSVYVKESFRKNGVFRKMFNQLLTLVKRDSHVLGVRLYVDKSNVRAQNVYVAMGMNGDHYTVFEWMK